MSILQKELRLTENELLCNSVKLHRLFVMFVVVVRWCSSLVDLFDFNLSRCQS